MISLDQPYPSHLAASPWQVADSMNRDDITQRVGPWRILTFASAASADSQFEDCVRSLKFDVHRPVVPSIEGKFFRMRAFKGPPALLV